MKRPVIGGIAIAAAVVLVAGAAVGVLAYWSTTESLNQSQADPTTVTTAQTADYRRVLEGWPYPFAPGDAVPKTPPTLSENPPSPQNDRTYVSFFYQCSWINALVNGPKSSHANALVSLQAWNDLPASVSSADNGDGGWKATVLDPAAAGNLKPIVNYFKSCTPYQSTRTSPSKGLTVDRSLPVATTPSPTDSASASASGSVGSCATADAVDSGPAHAANGTTTLNAAGVPVAYKVAPGDIYVDVAHRFGFSDACLYVLNCVRRDPSSTFTLFVGDPINLDWTTVKSVGSSNGKVFDNESCFAADPPYPPQH